MSRTAEQKKQRSRIRRTRLSPELAREIIRQISDNYRIGNIGNAEGQYPPYKLTSFEDRAVFQRYVEHVILSFVRPTP